MTDSPPLKRKDLIVHTAIQESAGIDLEGSEKIFLIIRKHWIYLVETGLYFGMLCLICGGLYVLGVFASIPPVFTLVTVVGVMMIGLLYVFIQWVNSALDMLIVTNRRIIAYDQVSFLSRKMSQTNIELVTEVNAFASGFLGNMLLYGAVIIKTTSDSTGEKSSFDMTLAPNPIDISKKIHGYINENRHRPAVENKQ